MVLNKHVGVTKIQNDSIYYDLLHQTVKYGLQLSGKIPFQGKMELDEGPWWNVYRGGRLTKHHGSGDLKWK